MMGMLAAGVATPLLLPKNSNGADAGLTIDSGWTLSLQNGETQLDRRGGTYAADLSGNVVLRHVVSSQRGQPGNQAAIVIQATKVSRFATGEAASRIFINKIDADRPYGPESNPDDPRWVPLTDFVAFHNNQAVPRNSERIIRQFYHTSLAVRGGAVRTEEAAEIFLPPQYEEISARLVRTTTILRFAITEAYPLQFSTGHFSSDFTRVHYRLLAINYDLPMVEFTAVALK